MARIEVESEVAGSVWEMLKDPGDMVTTGEPIMTLESMKMEIPVEAPADGRLSEIMVGERELVEEGMILAVIETE